MMSMLVSLLTYNKTLPWLSSEFVPSWRRKELILTTGMINMLNQKYSSLCEMFLRASVFEPLSIWVLTTQRAQAVKTLWDPLCSWTNSSTQHVLILGQFRFQCQWIDLRLLQAHHSAYGDEQQRYNRCKRGQVPISKSFDLGFSLLHPCDPIVSSLENAKPLNMVHSSGSTIPPGVLWILGSTSLNMRNLCCQPPADCTRTGKEKGRFREACSR